MRRIVCTMFAGALMLGSTALAAAHDGATTHSTAAKQTVRSHKVVETGAALRDLWVGHIFWVRNVVVATLSNNTSAADAAEQQAVDNAKAIAGAFEPFYGAAAKDALFKLLARHYGAVKAYLTATAAADAGAQSKATDALTKNAEEIAVFLGKANPNWPKGTVQGLLLAHGGHHIQQIQELKAGNYAAEAKTWEEMKKHMYVIADALTQGLVKQFASKFQG